MAEIPSYFEDVQAISDIVSYNRWKKLGFPRANWEECDNRYVELVDRLKDLDDFYHPQNHLI